MGNFMIDTLNHFDSLRILEDISDNFDRVQEALFDCEFKFDCLNDNRVVENGYYDIVISIETEIGMRGD